MVNHCRIRFFFVDCIIFNPGRTHIDVKKKISKLLGGGGGAIAPSAPRLLRPCMDTTHLAKCFEKLKLKIRLLKNLGVLGTKLQEENLRSATTFVKLFFFQSRIACMIVIVRWCHGGRIGVLLCSAAAGGCFCLLLHSCLQSK